MYRATSVIEVTYVQVLKLFGNVLNIVLKSIAFEVLTPADTVISPITSYSHSSASLLYLLIFSFCLSPNRVPERTVSAGDMEKEKDLND